MSVDRYDVIAVRYGELPSTREFAFLNYADYGEPDGPITLGYFFWVIRNERRTIVLDTGFAADVGRRRGRTVLVDPRDAFEALDVPDSDDTTVVLSHAHYDHIGNVDRFQRAGLIMAAAEYDYWIAKPRDLHLTRHLVEPRELEILRDAERSGRLRLIEGELELAPGLLIHPAPGHTPGELIVSARTADGTILLAADAVHFDEELDRRMPFRHMCDIVAADDTYTSIDALRDRGAVDRVIAGHEWELPDGAIPVPQLPDHAFLLSAGGNPFPTERGPLATL